MNSGSDVRPLTAFNPPQEKVETLKMNTGFTALVGLAIVALLGANAPASAWTPPIGIPDPGFGITDTIPARTHYVDNSGTCDDSNNGGLGSPAAPRCTIPTTLAAGASVEVHGGPYLYQGSCPDAFVANGTVQSRVYVWGVISGGNKPVIQGDRIHSGTCFQPNGTYYVVDGFRFSNGTTLVVIARGSYGVIRNSEFVNYQPQADAQGRQYGEVLTAVGDHFVFYNNVFRDNGNYLSTVDNKVQGIKIGGLAGTVGTGYVWILNNIFYHNGQGMQHGDDCVGTIVNGLCQPDIAAFPHHFYIGYNVIHDDREVGIALKMVHDFVISQNEVYNYKDLPAGADCANSPIPTALNIGRYASDKVWVLFNKVHDSVIGIRSNGNDEGYTGPTPVFPSVYLIGNVVTDIHGSTSTTGANCVPYGAIDPYSGGAAILGWNNYRLYVVNNTIAHSDKGISLTSVGYYEVTGNLVTSTGDLMNFVPANWGTNKYDYNFYDGTARLAYGSTTPIISLANVQSYGQETHSRQGSALLDSNYRPMSGSPVVDVGVRSAVYDTFFSLYGINIAKDIQGRTRPQGAAWDIGAYELGGTVGSLPAPSGLVVR